MKFKKIGYFDQKSFTPEADTFFLVTDNWNDQGYYTYFHLIYCGSDLVKNKIGTLRIAFKGQTEGDYTDIKIAQVFNKLEDNFYSLGTDEEYYLNLKKLDPSIQLEILDNLNDIANKKSLLDEVKSEGAFLKAFLRDTSILNIEQKFRKIINDEIILTDFNFQFDIIASNKNYPVTLNFDVLKDSMPPTNIHTIIGRNGVGKTHILNSMIEAITSNSDEVFFSEKVTDYLGEVESIKIDYTFFSQLISVSFSAFDPFIPPKDGSINVYGTKYHYIGLKNYFPDDALDKPKSKTPKELTTEFYSSFSFILKTNLKRNIWNDSIKTLCSDPNFAEMELHKLNNESKEAICKKFERMSSGHKIVLLTVTKLVERLEEKSLVILDEPECHLHPPLLSAFVRALSNILRNRNAVAIIATHSPVVVQEVPKTCVTKLTRHGAVMVGKKPKCETFGENIGILTNEIFGLEVKESGFLKFLKDLVDEGLTYEDIVSKFHNQLGTEAKGLLRVLIMERNQ
ncbi:AAA family ATPase [Acinetobacter puyangensis]|uniref:AAA domain-containing protein, putative AbiEii toxin, Type IV TA system n=1 Tax=Acinetobacter puyangensis TaxID=1096779 RepID=A0A240E661_9GAMM|nr:AAA family ATPase [Acinetobacter puyangensis]SNX43365.1 AAA domain-containing protein, putative AbiEii toxin, Type IV TA system [Acinetobacter puyangensis]